VDNWVSGFCARRVV